MTDYRALVKMEHLAKGCQKAMHLKLHNMSWVLLKSLCYKSQVSRGVIYEMGKVHQNQAQIEPDDMSNYLRN